MSEKDNGGPAFPTEPNTQPGYYAHHGMTLRDWFAGQALHALMIQAYKILDGTPGLEDGITVFSVASKAAYRCADAMLDARK